MTLFHTLRKLCGQFGALPTQYDISKRDPDSDDALKLISKHSMARGGFADVWLGQYEGQTVAVKVFRIDERTDVLRAIRRVCHAIFIFDYGLLIHVCMECADVLQGSRSMETSVSSQYHTIHRH